MLRAGKWWIGDLCYVMHNEWDEFCNITISGNDILDGEFTLKDGRKFAAYRTAYGDGVYTASNGAELGVDAGLIGCILLSDIDQTDTANSIELGTVVDIDYDFVTSSVNGLIIFGPISINTDNECEEEYGDDEEYDY